MALVLPNPSLGTSVVDPTALEDNFSAITTKFSQGITTADLSTTAGIGSTQLAQPYQRNSLRVHEIGSGSGLVATGGGTGLIKATLTPIYNDGGGNWTLERVSWVCTDTGAGTGICSVQWGYYDSAGVWQGTNIVTGITIDDPTGGANLANQGSKAGTTLTFDSNDRSLVVLVTTSDGTAISAATEYIAFTFHLKRILTA